MSSFELEEKTESITIKVSYNMKKEIERLLDRKKWKLSPFIRVAIQESMNRVNGE